MPKTNCVVIIWTTILICNLSCKFSAAAAWSTHLPGSTQTHHEVELGSFLIQCEAPSCLVPNQLSPHSPTFSTEPCANNKFKYIFFTRMLGRCFLAPLVSSGKHPRNLSLLQAPYESQRWSCFVRILYVSRNKWNFLATAHEWQHSPVCPRQVSEWCYNNHPLIID